MEIRRYFWMEGSEDVSLMLGEDKGIVCVRGWGWGGGFTSFELDNLNHVYISSLVSIAVFLAASWWQQIVKLTVNPWHRQ